MTSYELIVPSDYWLATWQPTQQTPWIYTKVSDLLIPSLVRAHEWNYLPHKDEMAPNYLNKEFELIDKAEISELVVYEVYGYFLDSKDEEQTQKLAGNILCSYGMQSRANILPAGDILNSTIFPFRLGLNIYYAVGSPAIRCFRIFRVIDLIFEEKVKATKLTFSLPDKTIPEKNLLLFPTMEGVYQGVQANQRLGSSMHF